MRTKLGFWGCFGEKGLERREEEIGGHLSPVNCCAKHAISICILLFEDSEMGKCFFLFVVLDKVRGWGYN